MNKTYRMTLAATAAACTVAAGAASAQTDARLSRADVITEMLAARAAGTLGVLSGEDSGSFHLSRQPQRGGRTRAEVVAELKEFRDTGEMAALGSEETATIFYASRMAPRTLTRAAVIEELRAAAYAGELGVMNGEDSGSFHLAQRGDAHVAATRMAGSRRNAPPVLVAQESSQGRAAPGAPAATGLQAALRAD